MEPQESFLAQLTEDKKQLVEALISIGQFERVFGPPPWRPELFSSLFHRLAEIDSFYRELGGIAGYQQKVLSLASDTHSLIDKTCRFHMPHYIDISNETKEVRQAVHEGIRRMPEMAEFYPLGGAADRLHLVDASTGVELPAAKLVFMGRELLEGLIRDLQAREYLYYKLWGKQITTPIVIMTSHEKDNHRHVCEELERQHWFGRPKKSFRIFTQPLVPVVNDQGMWVMQKEGVPLLKPGGHGALWKRAQDEGVFRWLARQKKMGVLVRQINNPAAGLDYGLLAFSGMGWLQNKQFGFASCPRKIGSAEGINVLVEKNNDIVLTNIEYCDFAKANIPDQPIRSGEPYSQFSSNTNILFAHLPSLARKVRQCPFPGLLVNWKENGDQRIGRLESTMQNIADAFMEPKEESVYPKHTYITYNQRQKTISTAKRAYIEGKILTETPEACFYERMQEARALLQMLSFNVPAACSLEAYLQSGPDLSFFYHPALGPLYAIIRQKMRGGSMGLGSHMELEIADVDIENIHLKGALTVRAHRVMGLLNRSGRLIYNQSVTGRAILRNVRIANAGVDWDQSRPFWKGAYQYKEQLSILLEGFSELVATDVTLTGNHVIVVPHGRRLYLTTGSNGELEQKWEPIGSKHPLWRYTPST